MFRGGGMSSPARPQLGGGGSGGDVASRIDQIMAQLNQGPNQQQQQMVGQIGNDLFGMGANQLQEQANRLMSGVSSSAASRGLTGSSIGLGGATAVGNRTMDQLARLRMGINTNSMQQLLQMPMQQAQLGLMGTGQLAGLQGQQAQAAATQQAAQSQAQGNILGNIFGSLLG
jgi:hypothetical protein